MQQQNFISNVKFGKFLFDQIIYQNRISRNLLSNICQYRKIYHRVFLFRNLSDCVTKTTS